MDWKILPKQSDDLVTQLLLNRGLDTKDKQEKFFNPKLEDFPKISGIQDSKKRIEKAIKDGELIIAFGDYDVDGICGAAILYLGLTLIGAKVLPYIPHREKEGYGLSKIGLDLARDSGASLVITTDCGIVNFEEAKYAKEIGLDLIITDHHQTLNEETPECLSVVHCTQMCGAAVAWCLIKNLVSEKTSESLLDLVAIATISDMIPLIGINRSFVYQGLKVLNKTDRVGLLALFKEADIEKGSVTSYEIGHVIAPRLNAVGRLDHAIDSLRLICTKDPKKAAQLANLIAEVNDRRKTLTVEAVEEAKLQIKGSSKKIYILASENWVQGIIGLVAGRISEETNRPSIAISLGPVHSKGSARSRGGVNIVEALRQCSDLLVAVGGHPGAAGFTIETTRVREFQEKLEGLMDDGIAFEDLSLEIEALVEAKDLSLKKVLEIAKFEPFGIENPKPVLASLGLRLTDLKTVGQGKHLKGKVDGIDFIGFGMGEMINVLKEGTLVDLAYFLEINKFNGRETLQLKLKDLQIS